ncbi:hypothetical protein R5R35_001040 [Gryllus longicercus]|uniref:DUF4789 domain-containing protein n=1 Tax=Gryllus longicercus TaxID=2509291 RepID=A0AAN9VAN1_9ORTH
MARVWVVALVATVSALVLSSAASAAVRGRRDIVQTIVLSPLNTTGSDRVQHAYWFQRLFGTQLTPRELHCMRNGTVPPPGTSRTDCHWLFTQGPCAARQWLVLAERAGGGAGLAPACRPRPCAPGFELLADEARCAPQERLCPGEAGRAFRYSLRGEGRCHCKGFYAQAPDGQCRLLFARGSCPQGQMLAPVYDASLESLRGACVRNPCAEGALRVQGADGRLSACVPMDDLDCSLASLPLLAADGGVHVPLCADAKRHIIRVNSRPPRDSCPITDNKGACVASVVRTPQPFDWGLEDEAEDSVAFPSDAADRR